MAEALYERFVELVRQQDIEVATGRFQTEMVVSLEMMALSQSYSIVKNILGGQLYGHENYSAPFRSY